MFAGLPRSSQPSYVGIFYFSNQLAVTALLKSRYELIKRNETKSYKTLLKEIFLNLTEEIEEDTNSGSFYCVYG